MAKTRTSAPIEIPGAPSAEQEQEFRRSTAATIEAELKMAADREAARIRNLSLEYAGTHVSVAPLNGEMTRDQAALFHEQTVAQIRAELLQQEAESKPRPKPQGIDDASIELIKAEMQRSRRVVR